MKLLKFIVVGLVCSSIVKAAELPSNDIAIFNYSVGGDKVTVDNRPFHLTYRTGYDNQPKFSNDGKIIYFTRGLNGKDGEGKDKFQTDIMEYDFAAKHLSNISHSTDSSEYSPTPYKDGVLTIIGVADANGKQYLNQLSIDTGEQHTFTTAIEPVGYHAWLNDKEAPVFVLGDVMTLQVLHTDANRKPMVIAENIGRCIQRLQQNLVSFTIEKEGVHYIYLINGVHEISDTGIVLAKDVQDYVWLNDREVVFGQGSKLYRKSTETLEEIADLAKQGIHGISRLAIDKNNNRLAVVYNR